MKKNEKSFGSNRALGSNFVRPHPISNSSADAGRGERKVANPGSPNGRGARPHWHQKDVIKKNEPNTCLAQYLSHGFKKTMIEVLINIDKVHTFVTLILYANN